MTMPGQPPRIVTLVLVNGDGTVLGSLPPFEAETPWWMDIAPVVRAVRAWHGLRVTVLRLIDTERASAHGGAVSYLAQVETGAPLPPLLPWSGSLPDDPKRHPYARINGPQADLAWAASALHTQGDALAGEPEQIRTWNLSSIWRLPTRSGTAWLKVVPPFFAHEGRMLAALAGAPVPRLIGHDGGRLVLAHIPGDDCHEAALPDRLAMIDLLVGLQRAWLGRGDALHSLGLPDWRGPALTAAATALIARRRDAIAAADHAPLADFVAGLLERFAALAECGIGDTLVHGDFHPGNVRSDGHTQTLLDWGDCGIGHPLLDLPAFLDPTPEAEREATRAHWYAAWQHALPAADLDRAARLLAPLVMARKALIYQNFLDGIEAAEHPYHVNDVPDFLHRTAEAMRADTLG
jgi:hypothetical protein